MAVYPSIRRRWRERIQKSTELTVALRYIVTITIGPAFFSAALYLSLARIIPVFGASNSRLQPRTYTVTFVMCDFAALVLQAAGGGLVAGSGPLDQETFDTGLSVLRAGLAFHVAGMLAFVLLASDYARSVWRNRNSTAKDVDSDYLGLRETRGFRFFIFGMSFRFFQQPDDQSSCIICCHLRANYDRQLSPRRRSVFSSGPATGSPSLAWAWIVILPTTRLPSWCLRAPWLLLLSSF